MARGNTAQNANSNEIKNQKAKGKNGKKITDDEKRIEYGKSDYYAGGIYSNLYPTTSLGIHYIQDEYNLTNLGPYWSVYNN